MQHSETDVEKIKHLLAEHEDTDAARRCLAALSDTSVRFYAKYGPGPIQSLREIYTDRAHWNKQSGGTIEGFDALLAGLTAANADSVCIHEVAAPDEWFAIFTDARATIWFGMLSDKSDNLYAYLCKRTGPPTT